MTFDESLTWLNGTQFFGIKLGLENTRRILAHLGNPEQHLQIIHVAGTNGKGSVCAMMDSIFRAAGLRSGLYTSPHLSDFRERIRVDGVMISREAAAKALTELHNFCKDWDHSPTYFELTTALALAHFAEKRCDVVILETGMGGRLDATNAVTPVVSVITPIAMDHSQWLGNTITEIAGEKAGIIKPGIPVVSAPQIPEAAEVLRKKSNEAASPLTFVDQPREGRIGLAGTHQKWNASVAVSAIQASPFLIGAQALEDGLRNVVWPARFQRVTEKLVVDGAHNPHAAKTLVQTWQEQFGIEKAIVIFGALDDKDYAAMLKRLTPIAGSFFFVPVASPRSTDPQTLPALTEIPSKIFSTLPEALEAAGNGRTLIAGSLFLAGEALAVIQGASRDIFQPASPLE
ncbi:MAG: bifunctional folylpolyglutamate synthase/dihydrofolate synthase [Verrucomicrobiaceae bacterium]|nr:MAG: bifunctional folylpolyglutamate synthase/dihydrofolate synthase [Verrucomicrobiaceae bacterium]